VQLQPHLIVAEPPARQPRPVEGVFPFLDMLLGSAPLIIEFSLNKAFMPL
jgi:hypothetical protein